MVLLIELKKLCLFLMKIWNSSRFFDTGINFHSKKIEIIRTFKQIDDLFMTMLLFCLFPLSPGQYYRTHHDFGQSQIKLACGPRILTFFLYLSGTFNIYIISLSSLFLCVSYLCFFYQYFLSSDVEEGGETNFPRLDIAVKPKRGRAVLWPSVMDDDLNKQDARTHHEAKPVIKGLKLAANAWIHLYNFHVPNHWGCTGAFD